MTQPPKQEQCPLELSNKFTVTQWIDTQSTQHPPSEDQSDKDDQFKKEHRLYIVQKLKRREQEQKKLQQQFGGSSSDEQITPVIKITEVDFEKELGQFRKGYQMSNGNIISRTNSEKSNSMKSSVNVGPGKVAKLVQEIQIFVNSKKGVNIWLQNTLRFKEKVIILPQCECSYYDISKLKLIFTETETKCYKLKLSWKGQQTIFASSYQKTHFQLPYAYYIFSKIITQKMRLMNKKIVMLQPKSQGIPQNIIKQSFIYGKMLKKSRVLGIWQQVLGVINKQGFYYYKKLGQKGNLLIPRSTVYELWTRFEFQSDYLIIKLFQNSSKIQLAIPVHDFMFMQSWLAYFYRLGCKIQ